MRAKVLACVLVLVSGLAGLPVADAQGVAVLVLDEHNQPVEGAEGRVGDLLGNSGRDGMVFILGLPPGRHLLTVRLDGYQPDLRNVEVGEGPPTQVTVRLRPVRTGRPIALVPVGDPGFRGVVIGPELRRLAGAEVHLYGRDGRTVRADSAGTFSEPRARGTYFVRVAAPGHRERRFSMVIPEGAGREALIQLEAADTSYRSANNAEQALLRQLGRRLATGRGATWLTRADLAPLAFRSLCTIPEVAAFGRRAAAGELPGLADGQRTVNVCGFRANEVELVELGRRVIVWTPR